jgi:hypothetical protein
VGKVLKSCFWCQRHVAAFVQFDCSIEKMFPKDEQRNSALLELAVLHCQGCEPRLDGGNFIGESPKLY